MSSTTYKTLKADKSIKTRQCGKHVISISLNSDCKMVIDKYLVTSWSKDYSPNNLEKVSTVLADNTRLDSWDDVYDYIMGRPEAPNFNKVVKGL